MTTSTSTISYSDASRLYTIGNNAGQGFAPFDGEVQDEMVSSAIAAAEEDGWRCIYQYCASTGIAVLKRDEKLMGIGGDGNGGLAWAVMISDVKA